MFYSHSKGRHSSATPENVTSFFPPFFLKREEKEKSVENLLLILGPVPCWEESSAEQYQKENEGFLVLNYFALLRFPPKEFLSVSSTFPIFSLFRHRPECNYKKGIEWRRRRGFVVFLAFLHCMITFFFWLLPENWHCRNAMNIAAGSGEDLAVIDTWKQCVWIALGFMSF